MHVVIQILSLSADDLCYLLRHSMGAAVWRLFECHETVCRMSSVNMVISALRYSQT